MPVLLIIGVLAFAYDVYHGAHAYPIAEHGPVERPQSVPEPASIALLGGAAGACLMGRRRRLA
jgi:hypothetical protein